MKLDFHEIDEHDNISSSSSTSIDEAILQESKELYIQEQTKILLQIEDATCRDNRNYQTNNHCCNSFRSLKMSFAMHDSLSAEKSSTRSYRDESKILIPSVLKEEHQMILDNVNSQSISGDKAIIKNDNDDNITRLSEEMNDIVLRPVL
jgi:hypothetical protein